MKKDYKQNERNREYFGESILKQIQEQKPLIIGAGALGNEVIKNLVMLGIQRIALVDFDTVELSNLNRCIFFRPEYEGVLKVVAVKKEVESIFPNVQIIPYEMPIISAPEEVWTDVRLIIVAVDNNIARWEINRKILTLPWHPFVINGAIGRSFIEIQILRPNLSACVCCSWNQTYFQELITEHVKSKCDEFYQTNVPVYPVIAPLSSLAGAIVAIEAIKILSGNGCYQKTNPCSEELNRLVGYYVRYDVKTHETTVGKIARNKKCVEPLCCMSLEN